MSFIGNVPAEAYSPTVKDTFSGNGSTTDFTLSIPATTNSVNVYVENVAQEPTTAYTISGTTLTFTAAPVSGTDNIYVIHRGPAVQQVVPPAGVAIDASTVTASGDVSIADKIVHTGDTNTAIRFPAADTVTVETGGSERVRVDSSGNVLFSTTTTPDTVVGATGAGMAYEANGFLGIARAGANLILNRRTTDGDMVVFRKDGTKVGAIQSRGGEFIAVGSGDTNLEFNFGSDQINPSSGTAARDDAIDLGASNARFDDIYATNGTIQTSDRNEKQDIEELSEAEQRVAVAAKALMRKFRWKSAVEEKGDDARIHFGIIAQDLQAAFEAEGLDAGRYAMFISSTWWETYTDVPAVEAKEAVLDDEGNIIEEAIEAKDAYVRTDTYDTAEEAPEGAVERTRLGVRYPELLAFIIGAL